jgi:hypothetical protein
MIGLLNEGAGQAKAVQKLPPGLAHPMRKFWSFLQSLAEAMRERVLGRAGES